MQQPRHPSRLDDHLGFWLRFVSNQVSERFRRGVEGEGVTVSEWVALRLLYGSERTTVADLIQSLGMTKGAISKVLDRLEAKGLIRSVEDREDRRLLHLELLPAGRELVPRLAALADANDQHFFDALSAEDQQNLRRILRLIVSNNNICQVPVR